MKDMIVRLLLNGDASRMNATLAQSERRLQSFGSHARHEFDRIKSAANSLQGKIAAMGISIGGVMLIKQSAALDQSLTRIGQTADMSRVNVTGLRKEFFRMSQETGQTVENLSEGFNVAVQSGLQFRQALPVIDAVNKAMAVTGANAKQLTDALTESSVAFGFDLSKPQMALELLDKMTVAGRQGNAELENLSSIYARVAVNAKRAGMNNDQTLAFIETLSLVEKLPERLSTLSDSTLRLFTNYNYLKDAQKGTKVKFFDDKGARRNPYVVLVDIMKKYESLKTDKERELFKQRAFGKADMDTKKGLDLLFDKEIDALNKSQKIEKNIQGAGGTLKKDLPDAIANAIAQTGRLKTALRKAADDFIVPLNQGITAAIKKLLDPKKEGGLDLSGKELAAAGAAALGIGYGAYRLTGGPLKKLLGKLGGTGAGIAEGKAIEYATGVTPVFVVNMPGSGFGGDKSSNPDAMKRAEDLFKKPKSGARNLLPYLAGAGIVAGSVAATGIASSYYLENGGSSASLGRSLHGMPESGFDDDTWINNHLKMPQVKNDLQINIFADFDNRRVAVENLDPNTKAVVNLNRGSWNNILGMQ